MKRTLITACCLLTTAFAAAESVTVTAVKPSESSQHTRVSVVLNNKPVPGARVDFCRMPGDQSCFTITTGADGVAASRALSTGICHVVAIVGDDASDLFLQLSRKNRTSFFSIDLTGSFQRAQAEMAAAQKLPVRDIVREFKGSLEDPSGSSISGVDIKVIKAGSEDKTSVLRLKSDADGRFFSALPEGAYVAFFAMQGFRTEIVPFKIAPQGEKQMAVKLSIANTTESLQVSASR